MCWLLVLFALSFPPLLLLRCRGFGWGRARSSRSSSYAYGCEGAIRVDTMVFSFFFSFDFFFFSSSTEQSVVTKACDSRQTKDKECMRGTGGGLKTKKLLQREAIPTRVARLLGSDRPLCFLHFSPPATLTCRLSRLLFTVFLSFLLSRSHRDEQRRTFFLYFDIPHFPSFLFFLHTNKAENENHFLSLFFPFFSSHFALSRCFSFRRCLLRGRAIDSTITIRLHRALLHTRTVALILKFNGRIRHTNIPKSTKMTNKKVLSKNLANITITVVIESVKQSYLRWHSSSSYVLQLSTACTALRWRRADQQGKHILKKKNNNNGKGAGRELTVSVSMRQYAHIFHSFFFSFLLSPFSFSKLQLLPAFSPLQPRRPAADSHPVSQKLNHLYTPLSQKSLFLSFLLPVRIFSFFFL